MSNYELDDEVVATFVSNYRHRFHKDSANATEPMLAELLGKQMSSPVPVKLGAVVRTAEGSVWVLADQTGDDTLRWRNHDSGDWEPLPTGRITEVLASGVDL